MRRSKQTRFKNPEQEYNVKVRNYENYTRITSSNDVFNGNKQVLAEVTFKIKGHKNNKNIITGSSFINELRTKKGVLKSSVKKELGRNAKANAINNFGYDYNKLKIVNIKIIGYGKLIRNDKLKNEYI